MASVAGHGLPHCVALHGITVFCSRDHRHTISCLTEITEDLATDFELRLVLRCVPVRWSFNKAELGAVCGMSGVDV